MCLDAIITSLYYNSQIDVLIANTLVLSISSMKPAHACESKPQLAT